MASADKQLFAPMPLRAMAADLSGLQLRVLLCVASHDRLSLVTGKGQGCRASNDRMSAMIGCSYGKLCAALTDLTAAGFLHREKLGRHTVYKIIYNDEDRCLFGHTSRRATCDQTGQSDRATCDHDFQQTRRNLPETASQYIPLNGGIHSVETGKDNSPEGARLSSRGAASGDQEDHVPPLGQSLATFERRWKADWTQYQGRLGEWRDWLFEQAEVAASEGEPHLSGWAQRLGETVDHFAWETGEIPDPEPIGGQTR